MSNSKTPNNDSGDDVRNTLHGAESKHSLKPNPKSPYLDEVSPGKVRVSAAGVAAFNRQWPGSTLRDSRSYWFEFDDNGLVDTDVPDQDDGPAAAAMAEDCKAWLEDGTEPDWA